MAVPSPNTLPRSGSKRQLRTKKKVRTDLAIAFMLLILGALTFTIIKPTMHVVEQQKIAEMPLKKVKDLAKPVETVDSDLLEHEGDFLRTIKSCIPGQGKKCGTFVPKGNDGKQRIAVISPPGEMSNMLWHSIQQVVKQHQKVLSRHPIDFIRTSHVPPYGYGKTHGLTKIIRLVHKPLVMGVADAMQQIIVDGENHHHMLPGEPLLHQQDITIQDLKSVLRQFMRFHCRLSKAAAHTAILSINLNDFIDNEEYTNQKLYEFIRASPDGKNEKPNEEDELADLQMAMNGGMDEVDILSSELGFVSQILTRIQAESHGSIKVLQELDAVLKDELWKTKNLTNWPCESFWTVGEPQHKTELGHFATKIARNFSPNCTDPFANCWVPRDKCEAAGQGVCNEK